MDQPCADCDDPKPEFRFQCNRCGAVTCKACSDRIHLAELCSPSEHVDWKAKYEALEKVVMDKDALILHSVRQLAALVGPCNHDPDCLPGIVERVEKLKASKSGGLSQNELVVACRNVGVDIKCPRCASLFFAGMSQGAHTEDCATSWIGSVKRDKDVEEVVNDMLAAYGGEPDSPVATYARRLAEIIDPEVRR